MSKIHNPVVLINKTGNDTYSVAVTDGSDNYQDARLMACMELEIAGDNADVFSRVGYYMAAEIEALRERVRCYSCVTAPRLVGRGAVTINPEGVHKTARRGRLRR